MSIISGAMMHVKSLFLKFLGARISVHGWGCAAQLVPVLDLHD